ncbi:MAG: phosphoserine phosphatase SerB [Geminicoccaceae bacterium]
MACIVCLIAAPETSRLDPFLVDRVRRSLPETELEWLAPTEACELGPLEIEPDLARRTARTVLDDAPIDVIATDAEDRRKKILLCDMDSTIIGVECVDELAGVLNVRDQVAAITRRAMNGELPFREALVSRVSLLAGLPLSTLEEIAAQVPLNAGAKTLVRTMTKNGATAALVSGGFTHFTDPVARQVGFAQHLSNELEIVDQRLTGRLIPPVLGKDAKVEKMDDLCREREVSRDAVVAVGDGANDLPMLQAAGLGLAYRAHQTVRAAIANRIDSGALTAALYAQGYRWDEFVTGD